jgi:hypothetical protein
MTADERRRIREALDIAARERAASTKGWKECARCHVPQERSEFGAVYCRRCEAERVAQYRARMRALERDGVHDSAEQRAA